MPTNIPGSSSSYPANVVVPSDGDRRNAASVSTPFTNLADRTAYLKAAFDAEMGVKRIRNLATRAEIEALVAEDGEVVNLQSFGLFRFTDGAAGPANNYTILGVDGLWFWQGISFLGEPDGIAFLDSAGKVPTSQLPRGDPSGVASLDSLSKVPDSQLGRGSANGVASLDASTKVPDAQLNGVTAKVFGRVTAAAGTPTKVGSGFSVAYSGAAIRVTFDAALADSNFAVLLTTTQGAPLIAPYFTIVSASAFEIDAYQLSGTLVDLSTGSGHTFSFAVFR